MKLALSIIIPTFNEEKFLPSLLRSINEQTTPPSEIIVADAFSTDSTRDVARQFGCRVVNGGMPGKGRNNGAKVAKEDLVLFLDSDVILPKDFLEKTVGEMMDRKLNVASCYLTPLSSYWVDHHIHEAFNYYAKLTNKFYPHAPGFCIFVKKWVHERINGFDESIVMAEDHDYVRRAKKITKFSYLNSYRIPVSVRRFSENGRINVSIKYIVLELHRIFIGEITKKYFNYEFGNHVAERNEPWHK